MRTVDLKNSKEVLSLILLLGVFAVSRALYDQIGITFWSETYQHYWQFVDHTLLKSDPWRSIFYLHNQPPLLNILTAVVLQVFPAHIQGVFHFLFFFVGLLLAVSVYFLGINLGLPRWLSLICAALFAVSPSTILYEHWFMYGYLIAGMLALAGVALHRFAESEKLLWGILFFSLLAFIALTWTLFHYLWMIAVSILTLYLFRDRRKVMLAALVPLLVVFGWSAKNFFVFGEFTTGSWGGMNLANMTTFRLDEKERREMIKSGELSQFAAYLPFRNPDVYLKLLPDTPTTGIPALDVAEFPGGVLNYHHIVYLDATNYYLQDALHLIRVKPMLYFRSVAQSLYIFFHSSSDFELLWDLRKPIQTFDVVWNRLFYGQWLNDESPGERMTEISLFHVGWWIVAAFLIGVLGSSRSLWKNPGLIHTPGGFLTLFMLLNVLYVTAAGTLMDIGENNRFRYVIDPFILLLAVHVVNKYVSSRQGKAFQPSAG